MTAAALQPVIAGGKCIGHVLRTARGARAFDRNDVEIGTFASAEQAIAAISARASPAHRCG